MIYQPPIPPYVQLYGGFLVFKYVQITASHGDTPETGCFLSYLSYIRKGGIG